MNLRKLVEIISDIASSLPNVTVVSTSDIWDLNNSDVSYPSVVIVQNTHTLDLEESWMHYNFNIYYADLLIENNKNEIELNSTAISNLGAIILQLQENGVVVKNASFTSFTQKFQSLTAGAFINVTLSIPSSECEWDSINPHCDVQE